ncbi:MAG: hypothetical protein IKS90_02860 [Clostridia bacterium]|nr:hypothetical protein [Clostridia bacterium]
MKKTVNEKSIAELLDGLDEAKASFEDDTGSGDETEALARLGEAFIKRLDLPKGMSAAEAAETIISMWDEADARGEKYPSADENTAYESTARLPKTLRGGLNELPEADYESMTSEQFRRLKKQLKRADMDGRRIRL